MKISPTINPLSSALGSFDYPRCGVFADAVYFSDTFEPFDLKHIDISIGGDDAFWMDEIRVYRRDFANDRFKDNLVGHWGRDNGKGWCLSTDANDINGSFKDRSTSSGCVTTFRFQVEDEKVFKIR
jgi:hypothetical protein